MKAVVFTLGCKVNECESDALIYGLKQKGYEVSDKLEYADIYIINTCAVTLEAEKKSRQVSARVSKLNKNAPVYFCGCACEKNPLPFAEKSNAKLVTGVFNKTQILEMLDKTGVNVFPQTESYEEMPTTNSLRTRAYVNVQNGCNNFCSYCIVPFLRGRSRSRNPENVLKELSAIKAKEVVINGINLSAYNYNGITLTGLIKALKGVKTRIRLGSLEVRVIDEEFLKACKELNDFAPHFHLSLQSGSNAVLKSMNRHYGREEYLEKVNLIRKYFPYAGITTDIIVGFPTETEQDFLYTLDLVKKAEFSDIHPFIFSRREGTVAYKMKDLPYEIKKERLNRILTYKEECKTNFVKKCTNKEVKVLIEYCKDGYGEGYAENYLRVYIKGNLKENEFVKAKITEKFKDGAIAEII